jgi:hypothetical protein
MTTSTKIYRNPYVTRLHAPEVRSFDAVGKDAYIAAIDEIEKDPDVASKVFDGSDMQRFLVRHVSAHRWLAVGFLCRPIIEFREIYVVFAVILDERVAGSLEKVRSDVMAKMAAASVVVVERQLA